MMIPNGTRNLFGVQGLVAVITGGATGVGLMMSRGLLNNGAAKVYALGDKKTSLDKAVNELVRTI